MEELHMILAIIGIMWFLVALAICIDLFSGVRKAKERGEVRTSYGFQQTVNKVVMYYCFMLFALMFDCIGMFFYPLPFTTLVAATFLIFIEFKSVLEKAHEKDKRKFNKSMRDLAILLDNREDLMNGFVEIVKQKMEDAKPEEKKTE